MALPTVADLKAYLRIEQDAEDDLLTAMRAQAIGMIELWTDTPIVAVSRVAYDPAAADANPPCPLTALMFPWRPIGPTVTVKDADDATVDPDTYRVDQRAAMIFAKRGVVFDNPPYQITASVGLSLWDNYATSLEYVIGQIITDLVSDMYSRRTPLATHETGAATTIGWDVSAEAAGRARRSLETLKLPVAM